VDSGFKTAANGPPAASTDIERHFKLYTAIAYTLNRPLKMGQLMRLNSRLSWKYAPTWMTMIALLVALSGGILLTGSSVQAAEVTLAWDANSETDLAGYYLYYRSCPTSQTCTAIGDLDGLPRVRMRLNAEIQTPSSPSYKLTNLTDDRKYVFVVTAYNQSGSESGPSNTATYTAPPVTPPPATDYTITASAGSGGSISPQGSVVVESGTNRTFTITPNSGQRVVDVLVDGSSRGPIGTYTFNNVTADHTISASFGSASFTISATAGAHGSISPSGDVSVAAGSNRIFNMTPASGYRIAGVQVDGKARGSLSTYTFNDIAADHSIHVDFTLDTLTVSASSGAHGSISPSGNVAVPRGDDQTFSIAPDSGYRVTNVVVDGDEMGAVTQYRFTNVLTAHTIYASFAALNQAPTANAGADQSTSAGSRVTLDGSRSSDPDDGIATYQWTQTAGASVALNGAASANPSFDVPDVGPESDDLVFRLTVTDGHGQSDSDTVRVRVDGTNEPPQLAAVEGQAVALAEALVLEAEFSDPNSQDTHTATINWGDGTPTETAEVNGQTLSGSHTFVSPGDYTATVCVSDQENATACAPVTITVTGEGTPVPILSADFDAGTGGFNYVDDSFRDTAAPDYADGTHSPDEGYASGGLKVTLGGVDNTDVRGMSGAWETGFLLDRATDVTLTLRYNLTQWPAYEPDERSELLVQLDDGLVAPDGGEIVAELAGDGEGGAPLTSGWQTLTLSLGQLAAGAHTLRLGAYNNKKTYSNEITEAVFDDVSLLALLADGGRPTGGYETDNRIPAAQLQYLANGNGQLAIGFKIKDPGSQTCSLHGFQYSIDAGATWKTPQNGDTTGALNTGWQDNQGQGYPSAPTFYSAGAHEIYLNTKHPDLVDMVGLEAETIRVRFMINDGDLDSAQALVSDTFSVSNLGPAIAIKMDASDPFHVDTGPLLIQAELSEPTVTVPNITLIPPSPLSIVGPIEMSGEGTHWEYSFDVPSHNGVTVNDGIYQVVIEGVSDLEGNTTRATAHFVTDTRDTDGDGIRDNADGDDDNDGLPDDWELRYGLNPRDNAGDDGRDGDLDGDGLSNWAEYQAGSNPADHLAESDQRPRILAVIPQQGAGIDDDRRVPIASSFCMLLQVPKGLDGTDTSSVQISIYDGQSPYVRDLSDTGVVRLLKLLDEADNQLTSFWLIYDRSRDGVGLFPFDTEIAISVLLKDRQDQAFADATYRFSTETEEQHLAAQDEAPATTQLASDDPDLSIDEGYDSGLAITEGSLVGTKVIFNSAAAIPPTVGPINEVPEMPAQAGSPVGAPLNLQPPTVSDTPVKLLLPVRGATNEENLTVQIYAGDRWVKAYNADGSVTEEAQGWVAPAQKGVTSGEGEVPMLEVRTYHNTSVQVVENQDSSGGDQTVAVSCFISTLLKP
jgi:hypothetical protein